ncbi:hypothetical protein PYCCODRAFT_1463438 [Trametes coccinea BRFM310]|uniref:F-box domain-containing protein n=1 Tax=Trametes coccinea (strain BRFM310) TaxID=1353009 RepID=A0A1Y2J141_TRAC3|nr:hypothetical protein PYCCODRAFT_1463438 [Trametes coccinea BRFM310]
MQHEVPDDSLHERLNNQVLLSASALPVVQDALASRQMKVRWELLALNELWNATLPINRLPEEILADIFLFAKESEEDNPSEVCHTPTFHLPEKRRLSSDIWMTLASVCRHWRAIVIANHLLWQSVDVHEDLQPLLAALSFPGSKTVEVAFHDPIQFDLKLFDIYQYRDRFSQLHLPEMHHENFDPVYELFGSHLPKLKEVTVAAKRVRERPPYYRRPSDDPPFDLPPLIMPSLTAATLSGLALPWVSSSFARLHHLELYDCSYSGPFLPFSGFLDVLESLTLLKVLRLHGFLYSACKEISPTPGRVVSLPALTDFAVGDYEAEVHMLLQSVHLPSRVHAAVYVRPPTQEELDAPESMTDINFSHILPGDRSLFPLLRTAETVRITASHDVLQLAAIKGDEHLVLDIATGVEGCGRLVYFALDGLIDLFSQAPLRTLDITGEFTFELYCPYRWVAVFAQFPTLENLRMEPTEVVWDFKPVLSALAQPARGIHGADFGPPALGAPPNDSQVLCPRLKKIDFDGVRWIESNSVPLVSLMDCLRFRASRGVYLQELRLALLVYIEHMSSEQAMSVFKCLYHNELQALVPGGVVELTQLAVRSAVG